MRLEALMRPFFALTLLALPAAAAAAPDGKQIIREADLARGNPEGVTWDVTIEERGGAQTSTGGYQVRGKGWNSLVEFISPANARGRKMLMVDRNMWFVRPGLTRPVPISPRQRLLGNAANGDLASTDYANTYDIEKMSEVKLGGADTWMFDLRSSGKNTTYDRIRYWISKSDGVGVRAEFYTVSGLLTKAATFEYQNSVTWRGRPRRFISRMIITDPKNAASVTTLSFANIQVAPLPDATFNLNLLLR
jgi:hypothetical protein